MNLSLVPAQRLRKYSINYNRKNWTINPQYKIEYFVKVQTRLSQNAFLEFGHYRFQHAI